MQKPVTHRDTSIGIVGLGLMGSSIVASFLALGYPVKAIAPVSGEKEMGYKRIYDHLLQCQQFGILQGDIEEYLLLLKVADAYEELADCSLVVECIIEEISIKETVFRKIAEVTGKDTILASNTSAIPISILQQSVPHPERFIGIHWAEPAFATRFLEIICGAQTSKKTADTVYALALDWRKEPTVLRRDIRGFITNRLMYAVYREIMHLVDQGAAGFDDADKAFRYDAGSWITLMGVFRRMDYTGLKDAHATCRNIFPVLSNAEDLSPQMNDIVNAHAKGVQNGKGFYNYTEEEADAWSEAFAAFNKDIYQLAAAYPERPEL